MTITLVTDPTEPGFNSLVSLEEADEYFSGVYFGTSTSWDDLEEDAKARLLVTASRALSTLQWTGEAVGNMAFPRAYTNPYTFESVEEDVPPFVIALVCEWAKWLWQDSEAAAEAPLTEMKLGELGFKFGGSKAASMPPSITSLLAPLASLYLVTETRARSLSMRY